MRKYLAFFMVDLQQVVAYRGPMLFWMLGNVVSLIAIISVWFSVTSGQTIGTYSKNELITYYILTLTLWWINGWAPSSWIKSDIKDGKIVGNILLKPLSFYKIVFVAESAWHVVGAFLGFGISLIFCLILRNYFVFSLDLGGMLVLLVSIILSIFIICTFSTCIGLLAFWLTTIDTIEATGWAAISLLGGGIVPLSFIPQNFQIVVQLLPFRYITSFPLEIYFKRLDNIELISGFLIEIFWVIALTLLYKFMWSKGTKAYNSWGN